MKVLANQFVYQTDRMVKEEMILSELPEITIQTGDNPEDTKFEGDLIFTTIGPNFEQLSQHSLWLGQSVGKLECRGGDVQLSGV